MKELNENQLNEVSGGKTECEDIKGSFCYTKTTCDECGKILNEEVCSKDKDPFDQFVPFNTAYNFYEGDYGIIDGEEKVNLCEDCYKKRLFKK